MSKKELKIIEPLTIQEAAEKMGYTRQHVLRLVKSGQIKAERVGRGFIVEGKTLPSLFSDISKEEKKEVDQAVNKVFKHYGEALKKLSKE